MQKKLLALVVTCIFIALLFARVPLIVSPRLIYTLWPIGHIVSFAFWSWLLISEVTYIKSLESKRQLATLLLISLIAGAAIEFVQTFFSRTAQLDDIGYNLFGTLLAYLFWGSCNSKTVWLFTARVCAFLLFIYLMIPALQTIKDEYALRSDFPIIAKFDSSSELTRWKSDFPISLLSGSELENSAFSNSSFMKVTYSGEESSRVVLRFFAGDWKGYQQLKFSLFNPNLQTVKIKLLITDQVYDRSQPDSEDRFEKWLMVEPGLNEFVIDLAEIKDAPNEREMDLGRVVGVDFYMYEQSEPVNLYFNKIELLEGTDKKP